MAIQIQMMLSEPVVGAMGGRADVWVRRAWWRKTHDIATPEIRMVDTRVTS